MLLNLQGDYNLRIGTLTESVDVLTGTSGNDTFIGDNTGTNPQLTAADQLDGGAGTDMLSVFVKAATNIGTQPLGTISDIETVKITGGDLANGGTRDVSALTGVKTFISEDAATFANTDAFTFTMGADQSLKIDNQEVATGGTATINVGAAASVSSASVELANAGRDGTNNGTLVLDVTGGGITTLNLSGSEGRSSIGLNNTGAALTTVNVSGDQRLDITPNAATAGAVTTIDGSTATGVVNYNASAAVTPAAFAFTGGSADDVLTLADNALGSLSTGENIKGGAGTDKLGLSDTALTATEIARINQLDSVEVLGLNASITIDQSEISAFKNFSVDTAGTTSTINNLQDGTTVDFTANTTSFTLAPAVGINSTAVELSGGVTVGTLVTTGLSSISIDSSGSTANTITGITNSDNSSFTLTGSQDLSLALAAGTAAGSSINGSAATGKLAIAGSGFNDVIQGGSANDELNGNAGADTITGNGGNDAFVLDSRAETQGAAFAAGNTNYSNVDHVTDFVGNGASAGDSFTISGTANVFGTALDFAPATTANVTAVTVATAADFTTLAAAVQAASAGVASVNATAQIYDVTVSGGNMEGRVMIINDDTAGIAATDTFVDITGVSGALHAADFTFV